MKLLFCPECYEILTMCNVPRACKCGLSGGHYTNGAHSVELRGKAVALGANNAAVKRAARDVRYNQRFNQTIDLIFVDPRSPNIISDPADVDDLPCEALGSIPGQEWIVALGAPQPMPGKWLLEETHTP